jgi:hypothetical protein
MTDHPNRKRLFVSHNSRDKERVRPLAAALQLAGAHVWFDEWILKPGDSVPGMISEGIRQFETFVLVWSANAAASNWVETELNSALIRHVAAAARIVPIVLDDTPLPALIAHFYRLDFRDCSHLELARRLLGIDSQRDLRKAVQSFLDEAELDFREFWGVGVLVACPKCGAPPSRIEPFESLDERRDDLYRGARCLECGWSDASEV